MTMPKWQPMPLSEMKRFTSNPSYEDFVKLGLDKRVVQRGPRGGSYYETGVGRRRYLK